MRSRFSKACDQAGFTLLEIVITLIVASILGVVFLQFMGSNVIGSIQPVTRVQDTYGVNQVMEGMTADFRKLTATDSNFLSTFSNHVQNGSNPAANPYFGSYSVEHNGYITFDTNGYETAGGSNVLKVTISANNQRLTALFTK